MATVRKLPFSSVLLVVVFGLVGQAEALAWPSRTATKAKAAGPTLSDKNIRIRHGRDEDEFAIASTLAFEFMNPLFIDHKRFLVAETCDTGERIGWVQMKPLGGPNWELSSLYVMPDHRGKGVGSELVRRIMAHHVLLSKEESGGHLGHNPAENVYALTLASTVDWYCGLGEHEGADEDDDDMGIGFEVFKGNPPATMGLEVAAGKIITGFMQQELVCLRGTCASSGCVVDDALARAALAMKW